MNVRVKLFAIVREKAGVSELALSLPIAATVADARDAIARETPAVEGLLRTAAFAINREYASLASVLHDGDELAVIPPVSGG